MKILHYANYGSPYKGNFIQSLLYLRKKLLKNGDGMHIVLQEKAKQAQWPYQLIEEGVDVSFQNTESLSDAIKLRKYIQSNKIDVVHVHFINLRTLITLYLSLFGLNNVAYYIHMHNHMPFDKKIIRRFLMHRAVFCCCSESVSHSVESIGIKPDKINTVENAIDFSRLDEINFNIEKKNYFMNNKYKILMFGFDFQRKGVDIVLDAIDKVPKVWDKIQLYISISSNFKYIEKKIKERYQSVPSYITLLPPCNEVGTYYHGVDCFISASREEGFCYALIEAAYCKNTIIASKIPAQGDLELPAAHWFDTENSSQLSRLIEKVIVDSNNDQLEYQKQIVTAHYDLCVWAKKIIDIYGGRKPV